MRNGSLARREHWGKLRTLRGKPGRDCRGKPGILQYCGRFEKYGPRRRVLLDVQENASGAQVQLARSIRQGTTASGQWSAERGIGLILVLIVLALLSVLAAALLTAVSVDLRLGDNFIAEAQLVYLAEAGIEDGRETLRRSSAIPPVGPVFENKVFLDTAGREVGHYSVALVRSSPITLRSVALLGNAQRTVEARVRWDGFPPLSQAVTLNEDIPLPEELDARLATPGGLEQIVQILLRYATDTYRPAWDDTIPLGGIGSPTDYRVVVVEGNCEFGNGTGYGILLVRGDLTVNGTFTWNGLVLVIGQGVMVSAGTDYGSVSGAVFLSRTRDVDRSLLNPLGTLLDRRGAVTLDLPAGAVLISHSEAEITRANERFPYALTTYREY